MTRTKLARLYKISRNTLGNYLRPHLGVINRLSNRTPHRGRNYRRNFLNPRQIDYIVRMVMQDPPEGYTCHKGHLKKIPE